MQLLADLSFPHTLGQLLWVLSKQETWIKDLQNQSISLRSFSTQIQSQFLVTENYYLNFQDKLSLGSQYHFHMETQTSIAIPKEGQKMFLYSSTQWPSIVQNLVGRVLGINSSQVLGMKDS